MGMAASQARYLALTARKTNTEWEGQQINQARTALANQSANLLTSFLLWRFQMLLKLQITQRFSIHSLMEIMNLLLTAGSSYLLQILIIIT